MTVYDECPPHLLLLGDMHDGAAPPSQLIPSRYHDSRFPNGCSEPECPKYNPCTDPPR